MANILLVAEDKKGALKKITLNALTFANQVAEKTDGQVFVLAIGNGISKLADEIKAYGAAKVITAEAEGLENYLAETWVAVVADVAKANDVGLVCMASTTTGKDVMPRVAVKLKAGMASDVLCFDGTTFTRTMWAGNAFANIEIKTDIKVCTVQGTAFDRAEKASESPVESFTPALPETKTRFVAFNESVSERPDLTEAEVIVSGGRGLKEAENFKLIEELADLFGGAVGATRAAVDAGWKPNDLQVGQTGKIVASDVYIAVGISGAIQHMAGMKNSKYIVAINKDEEAPIFEIADAGLVADLFKAVPELIETLKTEIINN